MIPMIRKSLLAVFGIAWLAAACTTVDTTESDLVSTEEVASAAQEISTECHVGNNGDEGFCTTSCTCTAGQGDCNSSTECAAGMKCIFNQGNNYGFPSGVDVCDCPPNSDNGGGSFCSANCPCDIAGQGDCDSNAECANGMRCYTDAGGAFPGTGVDAEDDVCATCLPAAGNGTIDFCNAGCTCSEGEGDCDLDTDCDTGLRCFLNVGADFNLPADTDVCAACAPDSLNGKFDFCTPGCPCNHGQGDCDSNSECATGLNCVNDAGASFGLPADTDVCVDLTP